MLVRMIFLNYIFITFCSHFFPNAPGLMEPVGYVRQQLLPRCEWITSDVVNLGAECVHDWHGLLQHRSRQLTPSTKHHHHTHNFHNIFLPHTCSLSAATIYLYTCCRHEKVNLIHNIAVHSKHCKHHNNIRTSNNIIDKVQMLADFTAVF